ncbi:MAG TPA: VWA domain-containing protein [Thermoanaerobaculia bacterium]|nr:VWA domain-containing protein [Thermoanaerobaculia bacterium]
MTTKVRIVLFVAVSLLCSGAAVAQTTPTLSKKQKAERIKALPDEERKWLTEFVGPIILPEEENLFLQLTTSYQRDAFKKDFWERREQNNLSPPLGPGYHQRYQNYWDLAASEYDGVNSDAGRMVIRKGEPVSIDDQAACHGFRYAEVWSYQVSSGSSTLERHIFYRQTIGAPRKLWLPGDLGILEIAPGTGFQRGWSSSAFDLVCAASQNANDCSCYLATIAAGIAGRGPMEASAIGTPPKVPVEGLAALWERIGSANATDPNAKKIGVQNTADAAQPAAAPEKPAEKTADKTAEKPAEKAGEKPAAAAPAKNGPAPSRADQIKALPEEEKKWLTEWVAPIMLPDEEKVFLALSQPYQREEFKKAFWERREVPSLPQPLGPGYRYRYDEIRRLADEKYDGWREDAGKMVLYHGEPAEIVKPNCAGDETFRDLEIWTYNNFGPSGRTTYKFFFYRPNNSGPRKLWTMIDRESDLFMPNSCRKSLADMANDCPGSHNMADRCSPCTDRCDVYHAYMEIRARQGSGPGAMTELSQIFTAPKVSTEGLEKLKDKWATTDTPDAKKLNVEGPGGTTTASAQGAPGKPATPAPVKRKLNNKEIKELTAHLEQKYHDFLTLVDMIISDEERQVFLQIGDNFQKDRFIEAFWKRRSIDNRGLRTDFRQVYTQRVEIAVQQFKNLNSDRAKVFVLNGPPDAVIPINCDDVYVPIQIWFYERLEALKSKVYLIFYQPMGMGEYKLWLPLDGPYVLQVGGVSGLSGPQASRRVDPTRCTEWRTVQQAIAYTTTVLGSGAMGMLGASKLFQPPTVETEGVDQILSMTTDLAAGSVPLGVVKLVRFPELRANKIGVDLSLLVPKADLKARELGEEKFYNVDVIGEVVKGERLIDNFKYRFDVPIGEVNADKIPLTVRRYLYPGEYNLILKVSDGNQNAEGRITDNLKVPEQPDAPPPEVLAAKAATRATMEKAKDIGLLPSAISILPVAKEIVTGLQRFETKTAEGIKAVDFYLNGTKVMTKTRPPYDADLNLGPLPRKHTIRVVAYGDSGRAVGEDEYTVNEGREIFRVRVMTPEKGAKVSGPTKVIAAVAVPEGKSLQKLEFYSNESRVATLYQAPYEQVVNIKAGGSLGYVRIVGTLDDGTVAEDLRYVNAPAYISEVSVDAVELYTTVHEHGRPVAGLQQGAFKVFEDGVIQKVESFEYVKNLPLTLGVMIDTSASMLESLPDAEQAAMGFLDYSIGQKDRAFTISFDNEPYLLAKMTNRKDKLFRSFAGMRAEGSTALYDAIVFGLYQFTGVKGKKALVILTDGKDTASKFDFETTAEYVRRAGIAIYGIGLRISGAELDVKYKLNKLASATGGQTFYIDSAKNLEAVYKQINEELRSQYLLTYYSTNTAGKDKWRKVEIKVEPSNLQARTITGYYP